MKRAGLRAMATFAGIACAGAWPSSVRADLPIVLTGERHIDAQRRHGIASDRSTGLVLDALVPERPWPRVVVATDLVSHVSTRPRVVSDGTIVVGLQSPPTLAWVDLEGRVVRSVRLPDGLVDESEIAMLGRDRLLAVGARVAYVVAPDASVRERIRLPGSGLASGIVALPDGTAAIATSVGGSARSPGAVVYFGHDGERVDSVVLPVLPVSAVGDVSGDVWVLLPGEIARIDRERRLRAGPPLGGALVRAIVPLGSGRLASIGEYTVVMSAPEGISAVLSTAPATINAWAATRDGELLVGLAGSPSEVMRVAGDGTIAYRIQLAVGRIQAILPDPEGAAVAVSTDGRLAAIEASGRVRWVSETHQMVTGRATTLPSGGFVIPRTSGGVLIVTGAR